MVLPSVQTFDGVEADMHSSPLPPDLEVEVDNTYQLETLKGMRVTLQDVSYTVRNRANKAEKLNLLDHVSAFFNPAEMTAMMGPSGSGKTTLLDLMAGRKTMGEQTGTVLYTGQTPTRTFLRRYTGYVEQFDTLLAELTVKEMLLYTAELKRPIQESLASKQHQVAHLLEVLGLSGCANTYIGDTLARGISGGQAKRTNIGIALITSPRVLFLDEPTSGLDSYTAHETMKAVKGLIKEGITICATIHCPPPHTFALFNRTLLLQQGHVVYFGVNGPSCLDFFYNQFGDQVREKHESENPAEWLVEITTGRYANDGVSSFAEVYKKSLLKKQNDAAVEEYIRADSENIPPDTLKALSVKNAQGTPMWMGLWVMLKYRTRNNYMNKVYHLGRVFDKLIFTLMGIIYYWKVGGNLTPANAPNIAGLLFLWVVMPAYGAGPYLPAIVLERPVYIREMSDGLYGPFTYLAYKMTEELSMATAMSLVFAIPTYYLCALRGNFAVVWLAWLLSLADGIAFAYMAAAIAPSMDIANAILFTFPGAEIFAAGYLLRYDDIPVWLIWFTYMNPMWYQWGALMINQFKGQNVVIFGGEDAQTGFEILRYYNLHDKNMWAYLAYSGIFFLAYIGAAWTALIFIKHQKR